MTAEIISYNDQGFGVCYVNQKITFVSNTVKGDIVELKILQEHKKYQEAQVVRMIKPSKDRVDAFCPYFLECGGCHLQNLSYEDTLSFKKEKLEHIFHKFAHMDVDIAMVGLENKQYYRNKITLKVENQKVGFYSYQTNSLVEVKECKIASKEINSFIKEILKFHIKNGEVVIRSNSFHELLVHLE